LPSIISVDLGEDPVDGNSDNEDVDPDADLHKPSNLEYFYFLFNDYV